MLELYQAELMLLARIQLFNQIPEALQIRCRVGDHQRIGRSRRSHIACTGYQGAQKPGDICRNAAA
ncbi:hypothetical protein D3C78_931630 [compost metagenome]